MPEFSNKDGGVRIIDTCSEVPNIHEKEARVAMQPYVHLSKYENGYTRKREGIIVMPILQRTADANYK